MKSISSFLIIVMVVFNLVACTPSDNEEKTTKQETTTEQIEQTTTSEVEEMTTSQLEEIHLKEGYSEGEIAYDFELNDLEGNVYKLSELRGKTVVLSFFSTNCGACKQEMPAINEAYNDYKDKDVIVLGVNLINMDNLEHVKALVAEGGIEYPVILDEQSEVADLYRIRYIPVNIFIDKEGVIRKSNTGVMTKEAFVEALEVTILER